VKYQFTDQGKIEFDEAMAFYENRIGGLGLELFLDFEKTLHRLLHFPESAPSVSQGVRKAVLSNFPFNIIYQIENDVLFILAFMHQKRKPGYWKNRMIRKG
jgi:hypothetical protein